MPTEHERLTGPTPRDGKHRHRVVAATLSWPIAAAGPRRGRGRGDAGNRRARPRRVTPQLILRRPRAAHRSRPSTTQTRDKPNMHRPDSRIIRINSHPTARRAKEDEPEEQHTHRTGLLSQYSIPISSSAMSRPPTQFDVGDDLKGGQGNDDMFGGEGFDDMLADRSKALARAATASATSPSSGRPTADEPTRLRVAGSVARLAPRKPVHLLGPTACPGCPRQDSNLRSRLRRAVLYPLSYGGGTENHPSAPRERARRGPLIKTSAAVCHPAPPATGVGSPIRRSAR